VVRGDATVAAISAASILAKTARDAVMRELAVIHRVRFRRHAGYPVPAGMEALRRLGPSPVHRRSYAPVASLLVWSPDAAVAATRPISST
jgi:ribonuclease HII